MSYPPGYQGYPYPQVAMSGPPPADSGMAAVAEKLGELISLQQTASQFPDQFRAGVVKYPDRTPFSMVLTQQLRTSDDGYYGLTDAKVRTSFNIDVTNPTFLDYISFNLYHPNTATNIAAGVPIGIYLPLSGFRQPGSLANYPGRDFRWQLQTASNDMMFQTGYRSSDQANGDGRVGYKLPSEYELRQNDVVLIEAEPIGPDPDPAAEWVLEACLHVYKMILIE